MSVENNKVCCNCRHNIRKREVMFRETFINCYCNIDNHYIGHTECMEGWCRRWSKEKEQEQMKGGKE